MAAELNSNGVCHLATAVIIQAVTDYRMAVSMGLISRGVAIQESRWPRAKSGRLKKIRLFSHPSEIASLVYFFKSEEFVSMCTAVEMCPEFVRRVAEGKYKPNKEIGK